MKIMELKTNGLSKAVDLSAITTNALHFKQTKMDFQLSTKNGQPLEVWSYRKSSTIITAWTKLNKLAVQIAMMEKTLLGSPIYTILYADVDVRLQGNNLASTLYAKLIEDGATICASDSQSKGAQKMWNRLASNPVIASFAYDAVNNKSFVLEPSPNGLVLKDTGQSIYDTDYWAIITKKGGKLDNALSAKNLTEERLDELIGIKNRGLNDLKKELKKLPNDRYTDDQIDTFEKFVKDLKGLGFSQIGRGSFGIVFGHPGFNYVIKLFRMDSAYMEFVKLCASHPSENLPKFHGKSSKVDDLTFFIRVEKLSSINTHHWKFVQMMYDHVFYDREDSIENYFKHYSGGNEYIEKEFAKFLDVNPHLLDTIRMVRSYISNSDTVGDDFDRRNIMRRDDVIVISDPFVDPRFM